MKTSSNGIDINVVQAGTGDTALVFLHFWGGSSGTWSQVIDKLQDSYRCVALDARGQGWSDAPPGGYGAQDHADDVLGVLESLHIESYLIVGHSMGGKTAQVIASRRPAGLRGIALIASSPPSPMAIGDEQRAQMKLAYSSREAVEWTLDNVLTGSALAPEARERAIQDALRISQAATAGWIDTGTREDFSLEVAAIEVPVVIVAGRLDRVDPVAVVQQHIVAHYPAAPLHLIADKGHLLPLEAPDAVAAILREFAGKTAGAMHSRPTRSQEITYSNAPP